MLFDFMNVKEHLEFYAGLKEVAVEERDAVVTEFIDRKMETVVTG